MNSTPENSAQFAALVGLDWGDSKHAFAILRAGESVPQRGSLPATPEALGEWLGHLGASVDGRPVAMALEHGRGGLLSKLTELPWLTVYPVNPVTSARFRLAFNPSGAKDDGPDAVVILEILRMHRDKLTPHLQDDPCTRELDTYNRARRSAVDERTATKNQLTALLKEIFPQGLVLVGEDVGSPMAIALLRKYPTLEAAKKAGPCRLRQFYLQHNVRSEERIKERLALLASSVHATKDASILRPSLLELNRLLDLLELQARHIATYEKAIEETFARHPRAEVFSSLPGAGKILSARLLTAFGDRIERYPNAAAMQKHSGIAPVLERSGKQAWVHWRWAAPKFLRQTFVEWAGQTVRASVWAAEYYQRMKAAGKSHNTILRALAFKWIRILWRCWKDNTPYDETRYLNALAQRSERHMKAA
jgi:transposase